MNRQLTESYVYALTGDVNTIMDWRLIHDTDKGQYGQNIRGTLADVYEQLVQNNQQGWGVFVCINEMDGVGRELSNVQSIRTHVVDLDNVTTAQQNYEQAINTHPQPHFAVQTSPGKFHIYWLVEPYHGNDFYSNEQRKLRQLYDGDRSVIDATRVLRVPGFYHMKNPAAPQLVNCWQIGNHRRWQAAEIQQALSHVNIMETMTQRAELGDPELAAPSLEWLQKALTLVDPNEMTYDEWMSFSAAVKQSGWSLTDEETLYNIWNGWCSHYSQNDQGENRKIWNSFRNTQVGWSTIEARTPIRAYMLFDKPATMPTQNVSVENSAVEGCITPNAGASPAHTPNQDFPEILTWQDQSRYFEDCYFVESEGKIFKQGRFLGSTQFNGKYGGKLFIITGNGKTTDEPWKAATRSTQWTVPKVDHIRFVPDKEPYTIIDDHLGRKGLNTYIPAIVESYPGDASPFINHMQAMLRDPNDLKIFFDYMAHSIKYPGYKIPWAPVLRSTQGAGKTLISLVVEHALGGGYTYKPKAQELISSGSKFNHWMRAKLAIVVDEVKVDERRDLIEVLKPFITDERVEVQAKGVDQQMEDNTANWFFFTNHKDAVPIDQNDRRFAIFYSNLENSEDIAKNGFTDEYWVWIFDWMKEGGGKQICTDYFLNYDIKKGGIHSRAPKTSCYNEVLQLSRSPLEVVIQDCVEDGISGFRGDFISEFAVINRAREIGIRTPQSGTIKTVLEKMGYKEIGKPTRPVTVEHMTKKPTIYSLKPNENPDNYAPIQGYGI